MIMNAQESLYIDIQLTQLYFLLRKDIINHRDINRISLFNNSVIFIIINIYLVKQQNTLKYLKDIEVNIYNVLIMTGDFNIRDNNWDLNYSYYSVYNNILIEVADSFSLKLSSPVNQVSTQYTDSSNNANSVINFMFL